MPGAAYLQRRAELLDYFDRTAVEAWKRLASDAPLNRIRASVRAGRDAMRATLLSWLPPDLGGRRVLDAGCGTGLFAREAARRGAEVVAVDLSPRLIAHAAAASPDGRIRYLAGDMLDPALGRFDHVVAMDSLIHYAAPDMAAALALLAARAGTSVLFTFAPRTPALSAMHALGRLFPRGDRAPAIAPVGGRRLRAALAREPALGGWTAGRTQRITSGFYISQAQELRR